MFLFLNGYLITPFFADHLVSKSPSIECNASLPGSSLSAMAFNGSNISICCCGGTGLILIETDVSDSKSPFFIFSFRSALGILLKLALTMTSSSLVTLSKVSGLSDWRFYKDLTITGQHVSNIFENKLTISNIPFGQVGYAGHSYARNAADPGVTGGFEPDGFETVGFDISSQPVEVDLALFYDIKTFPIVEKDLLLVYDIEPPAVVQQDLLLVYDIEDSDPPGGGTGSTVEKDLLLVYDILGRTQPSLTFVSAGDYDCKDDTDDTIQNMLNHNPNCVIGNGDYSYDDKADCFITIFNRLGSQLVNTTIATIGNHDHKNEDTNSKVHDSIHNYFRLDSTGLSTKTVENVFILSMNTQDEDITDTNETQYQYVESNLQSAANNPNIDWIIVVMHKPLYGLEASHEPLTSVRNVYQPLFDQYGVDFVLHGHNHNMQLTEPLEDGGTVLATENSSDVYDFTQPHGQFYMTVGTGGKSLKNISDSQPSWMRFMDDDNHGILVMTLDESGTTFFLKIVANDGTILDEFAVTKSTQPGSGGGNPPPATGLDPFGISKFHPTTSNGWKDAPGWEYYSTVWGQGKVFDVDVPDNGTISGDPYMHFKDVSGASFKVQGDGRLTVKSESTTSTRFRVWDDNNLDAGNKNALDAGRGRRWTANVEMTVYFNRKANTPGDGLDGTFGMRIGSDHHFGAAGSGSCYYNAHEYVLFIMTNGEIYLGGEPYHGTRRDKKPDNIEDVDFWDNGNKGIILNQWVGFKFIKREVDNGQNIFLEVFRDMSHGQDGGQWQKLMEFKHTNGNWTNNEMDDLFDDSVSNSDECVITPSSEDQPHNHSGGMCYLRLSTVKEIDIKWLSIRDIDPLN